MDWSDYIAIIAAIISAVSMAFTFQSSRQAKRQANAVLGDVPPSFGLYQNPIEPHELQASISLEIINHNRKALLIHSLRLERPDSVFIFSTQDESEYNLWNIIKSVTDENSEYIPQVPYRLRGSGLNSLPPSLELPFICHWNNYEQCKREPVKIYFKIEYSHEGDAVRKHSNGCLLVHPFIPCDE